MNEWKEQVKQNLLSFHNELFEICSKYGREKGGVQIVYATKYLNPDQFEMFLHICREIDILPVIIGENRVQEAEEKLFYLKKHVATTFARPPLAKMVMIGNLQTNKINKAIQIFQEIHAVDSLELAEVLDKRLEREKKKMPILLEVNVSGERSKYGFKMNEIDQAILTIKQFDHLTIKGLMTMAPYFDDPEKTRPSFQTLRKLADRYNLFTSMGMSGDWKIAVEEGTDMIRIGSAIFK